MPPQIEDRDGALRITVPPKRLQGLVIATFGALGVTGGVWAMAAASENIAGAIGLFTTVFSLVVLWVGVMSFFNRTIIAIGHGQLRVAAEPIRWPKTGFSLALADVRSVHERRVGASERFWVFVDTRERKRMLPTGELGGQEAIDLCERIRAAIDRAQKTDA